MIKGMKGLLQSCHNHGLSALSVAPALPSPAPTVSRSPRYLLYTFFELKVVVSHY